MEIVLALSILIIDVLLLLRHKSNPQLLIFNFLILYFNYSICMGVYIIGNMRIDSFLDVYENGKLYETALILLFIFTCIRGVVFFNKINKIEIKLKPNRVLYIITLLILFYTAMFEVDRSVSVSYEVKVSPLYEYSFIFFIIGLFHIPKTAKSAFLIYIMAFVIVAQDFYYGGRVTSLQIIIVFAIFKFEKFLTLKNLLIPFIILNMLFTTIGVYRSNYNTDFSISNIFNEIIEKLFINDTAVYAYFASITHLFMNEKVDSSFVSDSLMSFIILVIIGGLASTIFNLDLSKGYLSESAKEFHWNVGGGVFITYFYFWFGPILYILVIFLFVWLMRKKFSSKKYTDFFFMVIIVAALPRWYLYTPGALLRAGFIVLPIVMFFYTILNSLLIKKKYA